MLDGGSPHFAVVYYDGDREINVGTVAVNTASLSSKRLHSLLSNKIRVPPHDFSVYLAAVGTDRKIPITPNVNLASTIPPGGGAAGYYFFLVKRSYTKRSKKPPTYKKIQPENNAVLLRRATEKSQLALFHRATAPAAAQPQFFDLVEYETRMMNLHMERERFLTNMAINDASFGIVPYYGVAGERITRGGSGRQRVSICEECLRGTGGDFHLCVNDEVTAAFRSSAGSISRTPAKNSGGDWNCWRFCNISRYIESGIAHIKREQ